MAETSGGRLEFEFTSSSAAKAGRVSPGAPFRMLVIGDFSGRQSRAVIEPLADRRPIPADVDRLETVIAQLKPLIELPFPDGTKLAVQIKRMESFHPDHLVAGVDLLRALRTLRMALNNPATFEAAAAQLQGMIGLPADKPAAAPAPAGPTEGGSEFAQLLGGSAPVARPETPKVDIDRMISGIVKQHIVSAPDPRQKELTAVVDAAIHAQMGRILHDPAFQRVEAAWRGVAFLTSRLNLDEEVKLFLLDASRDELIADLAREDLSQSVLYKLLVDQTVNTPGAARWAVVGVDDSFGASRDDVALLARLGTVVQQAGAALLAGATGEQAGCPGLASTSDPNQWTLPVDRSWWSKLRAMDVARSITLSWPRMLMRLPYGKKSDQTEIGYEESPAGRLAHDQLLWGSAMWGALYGLAQGFLESSWEMRPGGLMEVDDLPMYTFTEHGEKHVHAVAEAYLTDRAAARIAEQGITPVMSLKDMNVARFAGFSSIAQLPTPLNGPWGA